jgi:hypothetical protein
MQDFQTLCAGVPCVAPHSLLAWEAVVDVGPRQALGAAPLGERFIIPILGGHFRGGEAAPALHGRVVPGGADRQLWRRDGIRELDALYEMQHDDGTVFTVHNQVLIDAPDGGGRYAASHVRVTAPEGPHAWLNKRVFAGTLHPLPPERQAVLIRVWLLQVG